MSQSFPIHRFPGGIHPPDNKQQSTRTPIAKPPLFAEYVLPLNQHSGSPAHPLVREGDKVLKGQLLAQASGFVSAPIHAPSSGTVTAIALRSVPHTSGLTELCIILSSDGEERWCELFPETDYTTIDRQTLIRRIYDAGIVGLGGAGFPSAVKMVSCNEAKIHTLIINGAECEPYITADDMLMRERADRIVIGIDILCHLLNPKQVLVGIEDNKPEATRIMEIAFQKRTYQVVTIPTLYPSGDAHRLIYLLTGREVPCDTRSIDAGILCYNTGTIAAIHDAIILGRPLISRITTLTGDALTQPQNVEALIGTLATDLLDFAELRKDDMHSLILGGPMMGFTLDTADIPVIKTTNCLIAGIEQEFPASPPARACIRCGDCALVCPVMLLPQQLYWHAKAANNDQLQHHNLFDCIECGACSYVCPSHIPLVQYFRAGKHQIRTLQAQYEKSEQSKRRFENRQQRLTHITAERAAKRKVNTERAARLKADREAENNMPPHKRGAASATDKQQDAIQAAVERTKARKLSSGTANTEQPDRKPHSIPNSKQKALNIQISMINTQLKKSEQLLIHLNESDTKITAKLHTDIERLREQKTQLRRDFDQANTETATSTLPEAAPSQETNTTSPVLSDNQKKLSNARVELRKAERSQAKAIEIDNDQTEVLKLKVANCRQILTECEQQLTTTASSDKTMTGKPTNERE
ncbi:MAG: electron transport complex subunit RsxC [Endozoicomonadaceae bacterium]|nr:electron transport complex subunit RsxC [Endozoicomonadaceae bacterium]